MLQFSSSIFLIPVSFLLVSFQSLIAGGNFSLALLLMVVTNSVGVFIVSAMLVWLTDLSSGVSLTRLGEITLVFFLNCFLPTAVSNGVGQASYVFLCRCALVTRRPYSPGGPKKLCFTTLSLIPMVSIARLNVVKQSSFGLPGQYGRRVTRVNRTSRSCTWKTQVPYATSQP